MLVVYLFPWSDVFLPFSSDVPCRRELDGWPGLLRAGPSPPPFLKIDINSILNHQGACALNLAQEYVRSLCKYPIKPNCMPHHRLNPRLIVCVLSDPCKRSEQQIFGN